jgi:hypothetical protein
MLLYAMLLRYQISVEPSYDAWYQNRVQDRFADLSVPVRPQAILAPPTAWRCRQ